MKNVTKPPKWEGRPAVAFSNRKTDKSNETKTGWFFIAASVFAVIDLQMYDSIRKGIDYLNQGDSPIHQVIAGTLNEPFLVAAATGTAEMLYAYLGVIK